MDAMLGGFDGICTHAISILAAGYGGGQAVQCHLHRPSAARGTPAATFFPRRCTLPEFQSIVRENVASGASRTAVDRSAASTSPLKAHGRASTDGKRCGLADERLRAAPANGRRATAARVTFECGNRHAFDLAETLPHSSTC